MGMKEGIALLELTWILEGGTLAGRYEELLSLAATTFAANEASLFLTNGSNELHLVATFPKNRVLRKAVVASRSGVMGIALNGQRPLLVEEPQCHPELRGKVNRRGDLGSAIIVPLRQANKDIGVLNMSRSKGGSAFTESDLNRATELCALFSLAIANDQMANDLKAARAALEEAAEHRRLATIGQMSAAIAHEIRNPLTGISSAAQLIKTNPDECLALAEMIMSDVEKLESLCNEFLDFAKPIRLQQCEVDVPLLAKTIAGRMRKRFSDAQVRLAVEIDWDCRPIQADPLRLEQILQNLVQNALEASNPGGVVTLRIKRNRIEVTDNGRGMSENTKEHLFDPFFTTRPSGTGLGLSNVKKLVEAHGWKVDVRSRVNMGSSFRLSFAGARKAA